jgi:DNA-binding MarR family transcriptional regulator
MGFQSTDFGVRTIFPLMSKPSRDSTLYRLIQAGQLAHKALMVPLLERGLEPGDDALLFVLAARKGATEENLAEQTGVSLDALNARIERLIERDLLVRQAVGPELAAGVALTERGERMRKFLLDNWNNLEEALFGELKKKQKKRIGDVLKRFTDLLQL